MHAGRVPKRTLRVAGDARRWMAVLAGLALAALCAHQILGANGYLDLRERRQQLRKLESEVRALSEENQRIEQQIRKLRSDPQAIERIAREEMKLARPGEVIYTLPPSPTPPQSAQKTR